MYKLLRSKKGDKVIVTIFAMLLLLLVFAAFIFLFNWSSTNKADKVKSSFSSVKTEIILKSFLRSGAHETKKYPAKDFTPVVGEGITNADLISWTCTNDKKDKNYKALKESLNTFFDELYEDDWEMWIVYSNEEADKKGFGHKSYLDSVWETINTGLKVGMLWSFVKNRWAALGNPGKSIPATLKVFAFPFRSPGYASQTIPCLDGGLAKIMVYSNTEFIKVFRFVKSQVV